MVENNRGQTKVRFAGIWGNRPRSSFLTSGRETGRASPIAYAIAPLEEACGYRTDREKCDILPCEYGRKRDNIIARVRGIARQTPGGSRRFASSRADFALRPRARLPREKMMI